MRTHTDGCIAGISLKVYSLVSVDRIATEYLRVTPCQANTAVLLSSKLTGRSVTFRKDGSTRDGPCSCRIGSGTAYFCLGCPCASLTVCSVVATLRRLPQLKFAE
ncbi:hypothetical protein DPMN_119867 [Dreissena polymorpha]|uniref:Uncharacterized protein n=1 Tax=Dreissena polymorpha TaxID=45954 RepID=A0A9D4GN45_DREPO|nr:hypothetical protein DPMN_119867 [Dreissena polymorpha]